MSSKTHRIAQFPDEAIRWASRTWHREHDMVSLSLIFIRTHRLNISETETSLRRPQRTTLSQLRSGHCHLLNSYKHRIGREDDPQCKDCGYNNQDVNHLFDCPAHPTVMSPTKLWSMPADTIGEFAYLDPERLDWSTERNRMKRQTTTTTDEHRTEPHKH